VPAFLVKITGDIYLHKFPFWCIYKPLIHKVKGHEVREVLKVLEPGDILLRRYDGYLNTFFTPGFWGHAALYAGKDEIIHAIGKGVITEDILDFCRTDSIAVLRLKNIKKDEIDKAINIAGKYAKECCEYDYRFEDGNGKVYCSELINECYNNCLKKDYSMHLGNNVLTPDGIFNSPRITRILAFKH
jgi:uncharacterized protein YycO